MTVNGNTLNWEQLWRICVPYAIVNRGTMDFGALFLIRDDAPDEAKAAYLEYIKIAQRWFYKSDIGVYDNGKLVGHSDNLDDELLEQYEIAVKLIEKGIFGNDPFLPGSM